MNRGFIFTLAPCLALSLVACAPEIDPNQTTPGARAVFDPATGALPLPNDLLKDPATGLLALPIDPNADTSLTQEVKQSLNTFDGWLTGSTITLPFGAELDPATVTSESVLLVDAGDAFAPPAVEPYAADSYYTLFNAGREPATAAPYSITVKTKSPGPLQASAEFKQGRRFAVIVTDAVKGKDGLPAISHPVYDFLKSTTPLVDANGRSKIILPDADAAALEFARANVVAPVFDALEAKGLTNRANALTFNVFSTQSGARPAFNPLPIGRALPTPNDISATANAPLDVVPEALFDLPYDTASAAAGTHLFKKGAQLTTVPFDAQTTGTPDAKGMYPLRLAPASPLEPSTTYVVVLTTSIASKTGVAAQPSTYFTLARGRSPLIDTSTTPATINSPFIDLTLDVLILLGKDPTKATAADWGKAYDTLITNLTDLEKLRVAYGAHLDQAEAAGIPRSDIIALWTFTTAAQ